MITYCPRCGTQFRESALGESIEASRRCVECAVTVTDAPLMLAPASTEEEVQYDLFEWEMTERCEATTALLEVDIPYRWEADLVLVVPAVAEDEVDLLLDNLGDVEGTEDDGDDAESGDTADGGEEAQAAMGDLFVAADRLQHDPHDDRMAADAMEAATTVAACAPPYGIERPVWKQIQGLAETLATDLEEAADEDAVAADARALREYLRDLV
ncbi:MAG: hypothetical protein M3450_15510 [Actinomycetota bacterium]|nr:hypothetical protein [Actinomycetota bacterium]